MKNIHATGTTWRLHTQLSSLTVRCASLCQGILSFGVASSDAHTPLPLPKHLQNGRSMIEMLGVLAIIGVLSVGGIMGYSKAMHRYRVNRTIEQITYIAGNIRATFASQGNYKGLDRWHCGNSGQRQTHCILIKAHIVPDDMQFESPRRGSPLHLWNSYVEITNTRKNSADTDNIKAFYLGYSYIPEEVCIELLTHDWRNAQVGMVETYGSNSFYAVPPVNIDKAVKMCKSNYDDNVNMVRFYFDIDTSDSCWKDQIDATTAALAGS